LDLTLLQHGHQAILSRASGYSPDSIAADKSVSPLLDTAYLWIRSHCRTGFDLLKRCANGSMQFCRVDLFAGRQITAEFAKSLLELASGAHRVPALKMVKADCDMNQGLQEEATRTAFRRPRLLQHFVAPKELAMVEELNSFL
jgi:hypothetical protein